MGVVPSVAGLLGLVSECLKFFFFKHYGFNLELPGHQNKLGPRCIPPIEENLCSVIKKSK